MADRFEAGFIKEAKKAQFQPNAIVQMLIFAAVFFTIQMAVSFPVLLFAVCAAVGRAVSGGSAADIADFTLGLTSSRGIYITMFFGSAIGTAITIIYCRFLEKRSLRSMGLSRTKAARHYAVGLLIGAGLFLMCILINFFSGAYTFEGFARPNGALFLIFFAAFIIQGMQEEVMQRGYLMPSLSNKMPVVAAVVINSVVFAALHLFNPGITLLAFINIMLFGVFASFYAIATDSLWGVCAVHTMWNFVQGTVFDLPVSGIALHTGIIKFSGNSSFGLINGGTFGPEGGLAVTAVLTLATVLTVIYILKSKRVKA